MGVKVRVGVRVRIRGAFLAVEEHHGVRHQGPGLVDDPESVARGADSVHGAEDSPAGDHPGAQAAADEFDEKDPAVGEILKSEALEVALWGWVGVVVDLFLVRHQPPQLEVVPYLWRTIKTRVGLMAIIREGQVQNKVKRLALVLGVVRGRVDLVHFARHRRDVLERERDCDAFSRREMPRMMVKRELGLGEQGI